MNVRFGMRQSSLLALVLSLFGSLLCGRAHAQSALPGRAAAESTVLLVAQGFSSSDEVGLRGAVGRALGVSAIALTDPRAIHASGTVAVARAAEGAVVQVVPPGQPAAVVRLPARYLRGEVAEVIARAVRGIWPGLDAHAPPAAPLQAQPCHPIEPAQTPIASPTQRTRHPSDVLDPWAVFPPRPRHSAALREVNPPW